MNDELESIDGFGFGGRRVDQLVCLPAISYVHWAKEAAPYVVLHRTDAASLRAAVTGVINIAALGRAVLGIDVVEGLGELSSRGVLPAIGPGGDAGEIRRIADAEDVLAEGLSGRVDKVLSNVSDSLVAKITPGVGAVELRGNGQSDRDDGTERHFVSSGQILMVRVEYPEAKQPRPRV